MANIRLNSIIRAPESGRIAHTAFAKLDRQLAVEMSDSPYDGIVFKMEHNPCDVSVPGAPANGIEMNQAFAKQVLVGNPHTNAKNHERLKAEGYRFMMAAPQRSYGVVGKAREAATSY